MKIEKLGFYLVLVTSLLLFSCGRKSMPTSSAGKDKTEYDVSSFNMLYVEGIKQKLMGNPGDAIKYLEEALKINPESDAAYYQIALILSLNGGVETAKKYALKAYSIDQSNIWYLNMVAGIYYQLKNVDSAIYFYEKSVKEYPDKQNLQMMLGNLYSENKNYDKALGIFKSMDQRYGINDNSTPQTVKNQILEGNYTDALATISQLLKEEPDNVNYNGLLAETYKSLGKTNEALLVYKKLIERNPDNPQVQISILQFLLDEKSFSELFQFLKIAYINENISKEDKISFTASMIENDSLMKCCQKELLLNIMILEANFKNDPIVVLMRPEVLVKAERIPEAESSLESIIKQQPDNYYAWEKLLLLYLQEEEWDKLYSKGEEGASRFNRSFLVKILFANAAIEKQKYDVAVEELRKAEILAGDNKDLKLQVTTMRADLYYKKKDYNKAFSLFEEAKQLDNSDLTVLNNYAYYLAEQNLRLKDAEEMAYEVIRKEKANTTFLDTYAWVLYKRGKTREAAEIMKSIISSGQKPDAEWYEHYGYILKKQKKCDEAIEMWKEAVKIDAKKSDLNKEIENCGR